MSCRYPGDNLQVDKNGCYICEESHKVRGRFGLAWVSETPECPRPEPVGWQVEFMDTPSKVEQKCQEMVRWINCPPLPRCEPCPPDELCCKGKPRCNPCAPICNPCVPKCMPPRKCCPRAPCGCCCRPQPRSPQRCCCAPMCPRRCMPCPGPPPMNDNVCSCSDEKAGKGLAQGQSFGAGETNRMSARQSRERGSSKQLKGKRSRDGGFKTSSIDNWDRGGDRSSKHDNQPNRNSPEQNRKGGKRDSLRRGRSSSKDQRGKSAGRLSRSLKRDKTPKNDPLQDYVIVDRDSVPNMTNNDANNQPDSNDSEARKATTLQFVETSVDAKMAKRFEEDFMKDPANANFFQRSRQHSESRKSSASASPPRTLGICGQDQQQYQMTSYTPENIPDPSNVMPGHGETNYWAQGSPPPVPPHQMPPAQPVNELMSQNPNYQEQTHSSRLHSMRDEFDFNPSDLKLSEKDQICKEEKTHGRRWLPNWLGMFKLKGRTMKPSSPESVVNLPHYSNSLGVN